MNRRLMLAKRRDDEPPTVIEPERMTDAEWLRRWAAAVTDLPALHRAREMEDFAAAYQLAHTEPGRAESPPEVDRWRSVVHQLRQTCSVETQLAAKALEDAKRLEKPA